MRKNPEVLLKVSATFSFLLYVAYFFMPYLYPYIYEENVLNLLFMSPMEPIYATTNETAWVFLGAHLVSFFMVIKSILYAKYVYILVVFLNILISSVSGVVAYTGLDLILLTLINMGDAVVLYIMFFELPSNRASSR